MNAAMPPTRMITMTITASSEEVFRLVELPLGEEELEAAVDSTVEDETEVTELAEETADELGLNEEIELVFVLTPEAVLIDAPVG
jgi:ribulose kinase